MANNWRGGLQAGGASVSLHVVLYDNVTGGFKTGVVHTGITVKYWRQGSTSGTSVSLNALTNINDAYNSGGWKEASATDHPGSYRLDLPTAACATGSDWVEIMITGAGIRPEKLWFTLDPMAVSSAGVVDASIGPAAIEATSFDTDALSADAISAAAANKIADAFMARTLGTEAYASDGSVPVLKEILYMIWSRLAQFDQSGVTMTSRKLNGTDSAMTFTFNASSNPTAVTRSS